MYRYEKALRMQICYFVMAEEYASETKIDEETISVKEVFDLVKSRYEKRKKYFDIVLEEVREKIPCAKNIILSPAGEVVLVLEEEYTGNRIAEQGDFYEGIAYTISFQKGKIEVRIFLKDIGGLQKFSKEREIYFEKGILERIGKGGKSWIIKILAEIKDDLMEIQKYLETCDVITNFWINTISNTFRLNISSNSFSISDMTNPIISLYRNNKIFSIEYYYDQEDISKRFEKYKVVSTSEGDFVLMNASKRIDNILNRKVNIAEGYVDILLEFIKNLRVYESDVPEFLLK